MKAVQPTDQRERRSRVVVTGGAGFIGSHLCDALIEAGSQVTCVDNLARTRGSSRNVNQHFDHARFELVREPYEEWVLDARLDDVSCIYHQAAVGMRPSIDDPEADLRVNGLGALRLLQAAAVAGVPKLVFASTGSVLGEALGVQDEQTLPRPLSPYGCSKLLAESYGLAAGSLLGLDVTVLRYYNVVGPRQDDCDDTGGVVPIFVRRCLENQPITIFGTGRQVRSFTAVEDVVQANLDAARAEHTRGQIYHCASGIEVSILELATFIQAELTTRVDIEFADWRPGDVLRFAPDGVKAREAGFRFSTDWQTAVRGVVDYARNARARRQSCDSW